MTARILNADCREALLSLDAESVDCIVTSPPYWGLRDYGTGGAGIGLEASVEDHVAALVEVFREARRVLRKDGTLWLNYGDAYAGGGKGGIPPDSPHKKPASNKGSLLHSGYHEAARQAGAVDRSWQKPPPGYKAKDLMGLPWRVAFALQADGWWLRSDIIWHKPNPMPESVTDRPTRAHEYVFLLTKSARYFYDADAIAEPAKYVGLRNQDKSGFKNPQSFAGKHAAGFRSSAPRPDKQRGHSRRHDGSNGPWDTMNKEAQQALASNARTVWTIAPEPFRDAHFATFPTALAERCIKAGSPAGGVVLDPFGGAGTTGLVAERLGRRAVLIELNPAYCAMAEKRLAADRLARGAGSMADAALAAPELTPLERMIAESAA